MQRKRKFQRKKDTDFSALKARPEAVHVRGRTYRAGGAIGEKWLVSDEQGEPRQAPEWGWCIKKSNLKKCNSTYSTNRR
jgi:hypothetical protein